MLNELLIVELGARQAGIRTVQRHPDVKDARRIPTLLVHLGDKGQVTSVRPVPRQVIPWTLRDGQHNSFPFVQPKAPLWSIPQNPDNDAQRAMALDKNNTNRRRALLDLASKAAFDAKTLSSWPGTGLLNRLRERQRYLAKLEGTESDVVPATVYRFLLACDQNNEGGLQQVLHQVTQKIVEELKRSPQDIWLEIAVALLIGSFDNRKNEWLCRGGLLFEASGESLSIFDSKLIPSVSNALGCSSLAAEDKNNRGQTMGICALTGIEEQLLTGSFPQPNLPVLGQTYLFAKNRDIPANDRYDRSSVDAMPVGRSTVMRLAAALEALTSRERENITWRVIPGEAPKQRDLLLSFVEASLDAPMAALLALEEAEDYSEEETNSVVRTVDSVAGFEKRTERTIELVKAKVGSDVTKTRVRLVVFRRVDPANRKVVYANTPMVADLYQSAIDWTAGERNVPPWITLPVLERGERKRCPMFPPHIAPLGVIAFSKQLYIRGGTEREEVVGLTAAETMRLFLDPTKVARRQSERILRLVLARRAVLLAGVAHVQHTPECWERWPEAIRKFDHKEALRTITLLGVLLHKLSREKEVYMDQIAFKLGQLLAAADVIHAGYCADVRGGAVPPSLLGNQVFAMAQTAPAKALAALCRRWKPYDGWVKKTDRQPDRISKMVESNKEDEQQRGWDIRMALSQARKMGPLSAELAPALGDCRVDDIFRAELLLGYIAGLPKSHKEDSELQEEKSKEE